MDYLSRDTALVVAVGVIAVAAIAMGAATIDSTIEAGTGDTADPSPDEDPSQGGGPGGDDDSNVTGSVGGEEQSSSFMAELTTCFRPLAAWYGGLLYFGAFGAVLLAIKRRYSTGASFIGMYAIAPVALVAYFFTTNCASANRGGGSNSAIVEGIGDAADTGLVSLDVPPLVIVGVFGLALVGTVVVLYRASGDQDLATEDEADEEVIDADANVGDLAAAAAAAADRLERHNADVDNEVYRAWRDMTALLDVAKPKSSTPGEFAAAAIEAGLDEDDVTRLTKLFEEVRYGKRDPESREERAIEVFRSIEAEYGTDDGDSAATGGEAE